MKNLLKTLLLLFPFFSFAQSQINVTMRLKNGSIKKVQDLANPQNLTVLLQNPQNFAMTVTVRAALTNTENLNIQNKSNFKPSIGITVPANGSYSLKSNDLQEIFENNNLLIRIGDLNADFPPSSYTLCLKVIDYQRPTAVWSDNNCSQFTVNAPIAVQTTTVPKNTERNTDRTNQPAPTQANTKVEAPNLLKPTRDDEIKARDRQNVLFTWAGASGTPSGTKFLFRIVEYANESQRAIEVFERGRNFYEETFSTNLFTLGNREFELKPNTKYLWAVTAIGADDNARNQNRARSEIRVFTYKQEEDKNARREEEKVAKKDEKSRTETKIEPKIEDKIVKKEPEKQKDNKTPIIPKTVNVPNKPLSEYKIDLGNFQMLGTVVRGKLLYAYPEDYPMEAVNNPNQPHSRLSKSNFSSKSGNSRGGITVSNKDYYTDSYLNPSSKAKPMPKTKVNLVMVYAIKSKNYSLTPTYDLGNDWRLLTSLPQTDLLDYTLDGQKINATSKVLATTTTNEKGEFSFNFTLKDTCKYFSFKIKEKDKPYHYYDSNGNYVEGAEKGSTVNNTLVMRTCIIVVESPYYCSPEMFINPKSGEIVELPDQVSLVKSFELNLRTVGNDKFNETVKKAKTGEEAAKQATIENINVELFRMKPTTINLPKEEGQNLPQNAISAMKMGNYATEYPIDKVDRVVAIGKSNAQGELTIPRVVKIGNPNDVFVAHSYTSATTGVYNYFDGIKQINEFGGSVFSEETNFEGNFDKFLQFNSKYQYEKNTYNLFMNAKQPKILGRTIENASPLPNVTAFLLGKKTSSSNGWFEDYGKKIQEQMDAFQDAIKGYPQVDGYKILSVKTTDKDGYFEFDELQVGDYKLIFQKDGYKTKSMKGDDKTYNPNDVLTLQMGTLMQLNEVSMIPSGKVLACVDDEDGNRVVADIRIDDGAMYVTDKGGLLKGCAYIPAAAGKDKNLQVYPRSEEYFNESYKIDIKDDGITQIKAGTIIVYRRKHRMRIAVNGTQGANSMPLEDAWVEIPSQKLKAKTDSKGIAEFLFETPAKNFLAKVKPPAGSNWTHFEKEFYNIPSKKFWDYSVNLTPSREVLATVNDKDGKPLKNAQVYIKTIKNYWNNQNGNYTECTTNDNGTCKLSGIPNTENNVEVFAVKNNENGITYIGEKKIAEFFTGKLQAEVSFTLKTQEGFIVKDIWGFPVQIEEVKVIDANSFEVSGSLVNPPSTADFSLLEKDDKMSFKKVKFIKTNGGENTHQPQNDNIITTQISLPIRIGTKLQGKANGSGSNIENITLKRGSDGLGEVVSPVVLELASFEGAYQLKGKIELGESVNNAKVVVFKAAPKSNNQTQIGGQNVNINLNFLEKKKYYLGKNENGKLQNLQYKVHQFNAESVAAKSYLYADSVRLFSILHTNIANMTPADIALEAGYITVLPNKIMPFEGGQNLSFSLEKWKVNAVKTNEPFAWKYDVNNGGIVIPKSVVNTGVFGVELKNLIIKPDKLIADKLELDNKDASALKLGGFVPVEVTAGSTFKFNYDPNCYHDFKPHWKLTLLAGAGQTVAARIMNLDGLEDGQKIEFGSMNLYSDNQQQFNEATNKTLIFKKLLNFNVSTIDIQADNFTMLGTASMSIPNMGNNGGGIFGQVMYSKGANNKAIFSFKPLDYTIEGKGQVSFKPYIDPQNQVLTSGKYTANGDLTVYDSPSGKSFELKGKLTHEKAANGFNTYIEILDNQQVPLGSKFLAVKGGIANSGMKVVAANWDNLKLKTVMPTGNNGFDMVSDKEENRTMTLVVKGAIETDPSSGVVGLKGQDTGMGSISLFYDFKREEMRGNFFFKPAVPINFGLVNLTSSNVSMAVGTNGFFMMCNGTGDIALPGGLPLPVSGGVNFVAGYYTTQLPQEDINTIINLSVKKSLPSFMKNGIKGIYSSVNINSTPFDKGFDYGIEDVANVSCYARAGVAFEYRSYVNFIDFNKAELGTGMYAYGYVDMGGSAEILGIGVRGGVHIDVQAQLESAAKPTVGLSLASVKETLNSLQLRGCASITGSFYIGACVLGECLGGTVSKSVAAIFEIKGTSPDFYFQFDPCGNGMPAMVLNDSGY